MSLLHWWPLNGNLNDCGINNISLTNNGATINSAGKIGTCYSFSNNNMIISTSDITAATKLSLCLWLKLSTSHTGYAQVLVLGTSGTNWNNIRCGIDINGNGNVYFNTSTGSAYTYIYSPLTYKDGTWHHIAGIYNNGSLQLYIDGSQVATGTTSNAPALSGTSIYVGGNAGGEKANNGDCINDVRIYDHALSAKEIKEISKGLCLHYTFEDPYIESTTNLFAGRTDFSNTSHWTRSQINSTVPTVDSEGNMTLYGYSVSGNTQSYTVSSIGGYTTISPSTTYTLSVLVKYSSTNAYFNMYFYERSDSASVKVNIWRIGCTADEVGRWVLRSKTITTQSTTTKMYTELNCYQCASTDYIVMKNNSVQLEAKDHATPYVNGTRSAETVYDSSGYGYNGTPINNPQIVSDSGCGNYSVRLLDNANGYYDLGTGTFNFITNGTVCFWAKYPSSNYKMILGADDNGGIYLAAWNPSDARWYGGIPFGTTYCDGVVRNSPLNDNQWHFYSFSGVNLSNWRNHKYFLCKYANSESNSFQFHGYLADFKIYATALSAEDILAEYNRKAAIDKSGNLFTGKITETGWASTSVLTLSDITNAENKGYVDKTSWADNVIPTTTINNKLKPSTKYYIRYRVQRLAYPVSHTYTAQAWACMALYGPSYIACAGLSKERYTALVPGECIWVTGSFTTPSSLSNYYMIFYSARWSGNSSDWGSNAEVETVRLSDFDISTTPFTTDSINIKKEDIVQCSEIYEIINNSVKLYKNSEIKLNAIKEL